MCFFLKKCDDFFSAGNSVLAISGKTANSYDFLRSETFSMASPRHSCDTRVCQRHGYCYINRYHTVRDWSEDGDWITRHRFDSPLPFFEDDKEDFEWND